MNLHNELVSNAEVYVFPRAPEEELAYLREMVEGKEIEILPVGNVGYIAFNTCHLYIAEAPLVLLDWDDTAAKTTADKRLCWDELEKLGIPQDIIQLCDNTSRVFVGDTEPTYEPELEMRLLSMALEKVGNTSSQAIIAALVILKNELIGNRALDAYPVHSSIRAIYQRTRFSPRLFPDTLATLSKLRGNPQRPTNVGILTYGDPSFQFEKVKELLSGNDIGIVLLTKARKGTFLQTFLKENVLKNVPMQYTYQETPRGEGVDFASWQVPIVLFDDDPKQVESFSSVAEAEGIQALGVVRVRRQQIKHADVDTIHGPFVTEIRPSETYLDIELFNGALQELRIRAVEKYLSTTFVVQLKSDPSLIDHTDVIASMKFVADARHIEFQTVKENLQRQATD